MPHSRKKNKKKASDRANLQREAVLQNALEKINIAENIKDEEEGTQRLAETSSKAQIEEGQAGASSQQQLDENLLDTKNKDVESEEIEHWTDSDNEETGYPVPADCNEHIQGVHKHFVDMKEKSSIPKIQQIHVRSNITQIGQINKIFNEGGNGSSSSEENITDTSFSVDQERQNKRSIQSADIDIKSKDIMNICADKVTINIPKQDWFENEVYTNPSDIDFFLKELRDFESGHFILVTDRITGMKCLEAFALVDWILVLDFDPESSTSGLLSYVYDGISKRRSLHPVTWQEEKLSFTSNSVYWISLKGCSTQPDTRPSDMFREWSHQVKAKLSAQLRQLRQFADEYTDLNIVVLWPEESQNYKHIHVVLNELSDVLFPVKPIIVDLQERQSKRHNSMSSSESFFEDFPKVNISLTEICRIINILCKPLTFNKTSEYKLPTADTTNDPKIDDKNAQWLKENLDVLYLTNETGVEYDTDGFLKEEEKFFRGGTLSWPWWYEAGPGRVDIQRDITKDMINYIKTRRIKLVKSGSVILYHNPGSGGTTLAQKVLWSLKEEVPCVQVKQMHGATINDIADRIEFLSDKTRMPVLVLADGGDEQKLESIERVLGGHCCVILLYVKRYRKKIETDESNMKNGIFKLKGKVSLKEAESLRHLYIKYCNEKQRRKINDLVENVKNGCSKSLFDFGFAMHSYQYTGIFSYVQGYLKLDSKNRERLQTWKKALGYLALVYYYGQVSLPFKILAKLTDPENAHKISSFKDFPDEMQQMIVRDGEDSKVYDLRVSHHYIAAEILNQILVYPSVVERPMFPGLSDESKRHLKTFVVDFIKITEKLNHGDRSSTIAQVLTRTLILRDNKAVGENESEVTKTRQKFSQILEDVSSTRPYTERFDIYQALTDSFPFEAQFRAHLGRLYTHCRPEEMDKAEECFKKAIDISESGFRTSPTDEIPYSNRMELKNIYHMYGNMILIKVSLYTGKFMGDRPKKQTRLPFEEFSSWLLPYIKQSAGLFEKCRDITPIGCEECYGYISEIQVRLMFCNYVNRNSGYPSGILQFADENVSEVSSFVKECIVSLDELFLLCFSNIEPEKMDRQVIECKKWYSGLFQRTPGHISHREIEDAYFRRLDIAKVKMKYCTPDTFGTLEYVDDADDIELIVTKLEKNFVEYRNKLPDQHVSKRSMDLDYREWLFAIRHNLFGVNYPVEKVLQQVEIWHHLLHTPYSWFYLFVLKSLLGLSTSHSKGDQALLMDAKNCKEEMLKRAKHVTKPKYPREWLGNRDFDGIRRLLSGRRFFGQVEGRDIKGIKDLEVHKGTICPPNDRPAAGYIDLDLGPENRISLKVFFIPARTEEVLRGPAYKNQRVEFVIGFSLLHGYEAFNVKLIGHIKCIECDQNVERRSCEKEVECQRCHVKTKYQEKVKAGKPGKNGSQKS